MSAHDRALKEAAAFRRQHPEFAEQPERLETGETAEREGPMPLRFAGKRVLTGYEQLAQDVVEMWPPNDSRTVDQRVMSVRLERIMDRMPETQRDLLRRVYWERANQEAIAKDLGISQQAVSQRITTAENALKRAIADHGGDPEVLEVREEEL